MLVRAELENIGLHPRLVDLGEVEMDESVSQKKLDELKVSLLKSGLELMDDKKAILIERIKNTIVEMIHY